MTELHDRPVDLADLDLDPDDYSSNPSAAPSFQTSSRPGCRGARSCAAERWPLRPAS
jgi:hypothetical protein